jgi:hypothetical protein
MPIRWPSQIQVGIDSDRTQEGSAGLRSSNLGDKSSAWLAAGITPLRYPRPDPAPSEGSALPERVARAVQEYLTRSTRSGGWPLPAGRTIPAPAKKGSMSLFEILLVEDDPDDQRLVQEALTESPVPVRLRVVPDGAAALAFLRHEGPYAAATQPDLVFRSCTSRLRIIPSAQASSRIPSLSPQSARILL